MGKFSELKAAAMAATPGPWEINRAGNTIVSNQSHPVATVSDAFHRQLAGGGVGKDAEFIAAANPDVVLELLAELEAKDEQNKLLMREIEHGKKLRVNMQKNADSLSERIDELEAKLATPVRLPDIRSDDYHETGWFQHMKYYRDVERSILAAGFTMGDE
ncbi:ead/Ea22-like family protein [Serratia marcescens]|uniref:ead/Ea22-like family protein n=1 Tax=Serratia marcescens TaxID=615 RepID=UPI002AB4E332|nr:ead/Ea22-like family protein [Serratia marcescens]MDY7607936.1 ead/Ea22-like family protein [Serratia marcescens]